MISLLSAGHCFVVIRVRRDLCQGTEVLLCGFFKDVGLEMEGNI